MSRQSGPTPDLAIEYSARGVTVYDAATRATTNYADFATAGAAYSGRTAVVGLSRRSVFLRTTRVPNASADDVRQILSIKAGEMFPVPSNELALDFRLTEDVDLEGRLAVVCAVPTVELRRIREQARQAGIRILGVTPVAVGSMSIARTLNNSGAAIVSRDQEGIGIDLVVGGEIRQSRVVPAHSAIESEVCRTYTVVGLPCGDVVAADGVVLKDADADTNDSPLSALIDAFPAHYGLDLVLPEEALERRNKAKAQKSRTAFMLAAAALAVLIFVVKNRSEAAYNLDVQTRKENAKVTTARNELKSSKDKYLKAEANLDTLNRGFKPAQSLGDVVALMADLTPPNVWLNGVTAERGRPIVVRGTAKSSEAVNAYLQALNGQDRLRDVQVSFQNNAEIERQSVIQFSLTAFPVGNLTLNDPLAKKTAKKATGGTK